MVACSRVRAASVMVLRILGRAGLVLLAWAGPAAARPSSPVFAWGLPVVGAVPEARVVHPTPPDRWYGNETLWVDVGAMVAGTTTVDSGSYHGLAPLVPLVGSHTAWIFTPRRQDHFVGFHIAAAASALGPPLVHALHGRGGAALASLSLRLVPPLLALGLVEVDSTAARVVGVATLLSAYPVAVVLDSTVLAIEGEPPEWNGGVLPVPGGGVFLLARRW